MRFKQKLLQDDLHPFLILLMSLPLFFFGSGAWAFLDPDEGRYAEIPREMIARHDFVTPTLNYVKYFEKPPLLYWGVAGFYKMFGFHEWAARLVPALAASLGLFAAYALGRRMFGSRAGLLGAVVLGTCLFWVFMARFVVIDMLVSSLIFLSLALWWLGHTEADSGRAKWYFIGFWVALALGILAKGPMAVVLPGGTIFCYSAVCRQWRAWAAMQWLIGVPLLLLITAPWFVLVAQRNPEFNHFFWYEQHVGRFFGTGKVEHRHPVYWFVEFLPLMLFPWTFFMPGALFDGWKRLRQTSAEKQRALIFLLCGAGFIITFFSISSSKLLPYVLPAVPFIAVLLGAYLDWLWRQSESVQRPAMRAGKVLDYALSFATFAIGTVGAEKLHTLEALPKSYAWALAAACLLWTVALSFAVYRRQFGGLIGAVAGGFTVFVVAALPLMAAVTPNHSAQALLAYIEPGLRAGGEVAMWDNFTQSVTFYSERRVPFIREHDANELDELSEIPLRDQHWAFAEERRWFPVGVEFLREKMAASKPYYCVMKDHRAAEKILSELDGAQEIIWNKRRSIIGNRAAAAITPPKPGGLLGIVEQNKGAM